mmetsp:Transcript_99910/g.158101  ORF Transcript_99910/g.158101 Transcript_99910/m.158101 type:complete len:253 (-) Transcript_99910:191-949(-)
MPAHSVCEAAPLPGFQLHLSIRSQAHCEPCPELFHEQLDHDFGGCPTVVKLLRQTSRLQAIWNPKLALPTQLFPIKSSRQARSPKCPLLLHPPTDLPLLHLLPMRPLPPPRRNRLHHLRICLPPRLAPLLPLRIGPHLPILPPAPPDLLQFALHHQLLRRQLLRHRPPVLPRLPSHRFFVPLRPPPLLCLLQFLVPPTPSRHPSLQTYRDVPIRFRSLWLAILVCHSPCLLLHRARHLHQRVPVSMLYFLVL